MNGSGNGGDWRAEVVTTAQIAASLHVKRLDGIREHNHKLPVAGALECPEADLPIPPYALGYWLGNGNAGGATVTVGRHDSLRCIAEIERELAFEISARACAGARAPQYGLTHPEHRGEIARHLRALGVLGNKHIPDIVQVGIARTTSCIASGLDGQRWHGERR